MISECECWQESPANAKVSAWRNWYIRRNSLNWPPLGIAQEYQCNLYIVEKYFECATIPLLTMWVYLHSFSRLASPIEMTSHPYKSAALLCSLWYITGQDKGTKHWIRKLTIKLWHAHHRAIKDNCYMSKICRGELWNVDQFAAENWSIVISILWL